MKILDYLRQRARPVQEHPAVVAGAAQRLEAGPADDGEPGRYVVTDIGGKRYRIESDDDYLDNIRGVFEPHMVALFDTLVRPSDVVLDIGANVGCTAILFGSRAAQVVCFEPSPSTCAFLRRNVATAKLDNVRIENVGLGKTAGRFELTFAANNRSGGFVSDKIQASAGHQVEAIDIVQGDEFIAGAGLPSVDFVKIDVEGFERDVIQGLARTLDAHRPVVTLELNHWCLNVLQRTSVPDFLDFLRGVFPHLYAVGTSDICNLHDPASAYHVMFRHVAGGGDYQNIVGAFDPERLQTFKATFRERCA